TACMNPAKGAVATDDSVLEAEGLRVAKCSSHRFPQELAVVRMDVLEVGVDPHARDRIEPVDTEELVRPPDAVAGDRPFPAADVGQLLRLLEVRALAIEAFE